MTNTKSCESKGEQEEVKSGEKTEMEEEGTWETEGMRGEREGQESSGVWRGGEDSVGDVREREEQVRALGRGSHVK